MTLLQQLGGDASWRAMCGKYVVNGDCAKQAIVCVADSNGKQVV
jgi:hypothetical protein